MHLMAIIDLKISPSITVSKFMLSDAFHRSIQGPIGSGKSVGCCFEILRRCVEMAPWDRGIRKSKWAIIRNTQKELNDTTLATWMKWMHDLGEWRESKKIFELRVGDVYADILFRPLDTPADIGRVLSLELSGAWVNEAREVPVPLLADIKGRLRRYPNPTEVPGTWYGMINDTNPPEIDTPYYNLMEQLPQEEGNPNSVIRVEPYFQPSGTSPEAENTENLHPDYYTDLAIGQTKAWVDTYIHGQYSPSQFGKPVYADTFSSSKHVSRTPLEIDPNLPVIMGFDTGLTPAFTFKQQKLDGRIHVLREIAAFDMGMKRCISYYVKPMLRNFFPANPLIFIGDPAGVRRGDGDESSAFSELKLAFPESTRKPASTNDPLVRIQATELMLDSYPGGEPLYLIDPSCKRLIAGLRSKYHYPTIKATGLSSASPMKNDFAHLVEADQYSNMYLSSGKYNAAQHMRVIASYDPYGFMTVKSNPYRPAHDAGY